MQFKNILTITSLVALSKACSFLPDYPCCSAGADVVYEDEQGQWGVENGDWCGIEPVSQATSCWADPYPCCNGNEVVYTDEQGDWGVENGEWCGIVKDNTPPKQNQTTTTKSNVQPSKTKNNSGGSGSYTMTKFEPVCTVNTDKTDCVAAWKQCGGAGMEEKCCQAGTSCKGSEGFKQCEPDPEAELKPATGTGPHGSKWCEGCNVTENQGGFLWGYENGKACEIRMCECNDIFNKEYDPSEYKYPVGTKEGTTTRYWDCCKPSCSWPDKAPVSAPVRQCKADGFTALTNYNAKSGCEGGESYMCSDQRPWAVSEVLSYGYAAASIKGLTEKEWCCRCYALTFTSGPVKGKQMVVQVTNTGGDLGDNHFDIQIPGGGFGIFNGCSAQFNTPDEVWGTRYGGVASRDDCEGLPEEIQESCYWRFDWFLNADNPTMVFDEVECPVELTKNTDCIHQ